MAKRSGQHDPTDDEASPFGPIANPVDRFAHLPEPTRRFLESLREDDITDLVEAVKMVHKAKTIGRFGKWLILTIIGALFAGVAVGEAIQKIWGWVFHGGRL